MKKILFSTTSFDTIDNGPAFFINTIFKNIKDSKEYDFRILTEDITDVKLQDKKIYKLSLKQNIFNRFFYQFFRIFKYHKEAVFIQKTFEFDVLIYNNAFTGLISVKRLNKPVVVMVNDYNRKGLLENGFGLNKTYFKNVLLFSFERRAIKNARIVIVNSVFLKETIHKMYGISKSKIRVLYKGIDLSNYKFRLREHYGETIEILFVKGGFENGGFYELLEAIASLKEYAIKLTIIGPRIIDLDRIESSIKESQLKEYEVKGPMRPKEVRAYFNRADIFCVPSHKEALGVANMEALASGIPVISTNVGGIPEVLDHGKCGWMVEPHNSRHLAKAIKECIDNSNLRITKSTYGYKFVQKFNAENLIENFLKIVNEVT